MSQNFATPTVALWVTNHNYQLNNIQDWLTLVEQQVIKAKQKNADLILMPEYICAAWLQFAPEIKPSNQIAWMAEQAESILAPLQAMAKKHNIQIAAGSWPVATTPEKTNFYNRAHLFLSDDRSMHYDKLCLTPDEKDPEGWQLETGNQVSIIEWQGYRIALVICLDSELPGLSAKLSDQNIDLLLIPSMTGTLAGYSRVFSCAKARAVEQFSCVCVVGCNSFENAPFNNMGSAAVYIPCENALNYHGVLGELNYADQKLDKNAYDDEGFLFIVENIPLQKIQQLRQQQQVDVWPGMWDASQIKIKSN